MVLLGTLDWLNGADASGHRHARRVSITSINRTWCSRSPKALTDEERQTLEQRGHKFRDWPPTIGNMQVITWDYATQVGGGRIRSARRGQGMVR